MSSLTENELIQQAMDRQAKKLEYNRLYIKNRMANDPEFKKNQHAKSIACTKHKYENDPEFRAKFKQYQKERYIKHKELVAKGVEMAKNKF